MNPETVSRRSGFLAGSSSLGGTADCVCRGSTWSVGTSGVAQAASSPLVKWWKVPSENFRLSKYLILAGAMGGGKPVSSVQTAATLRNFAEQLREKTKGIRKRGYTLHLEGPGPFSSWKKPDSMKSMKRWKEETEDAIRRHIASEENGILRIPGIWLKPSEPGKRWTIATDSGASEIRSTTATMIWRALENKTKDLPK